MIGTELSPSREDGEVMLDLNSEISELSALRMEKWRDALLLPDDTSGIRICSDHFLSGNPAKLLDINDTDWIPTKNLIPNTKKTIDTLDNVKESVEKKIESVEENSQETNKISCRLCVKLVNKELCINIFQDLNKKMLEMITTVLGHKIVLEEGMSSFACTSCLKKVRFCVRLLTYFRTNEKRLFYSKPSTNWTIECVELDESCPKRIIQKTDEINRIKSTNTRQKNNDKSSVSEDLSRSEMSEDIGIRNVYDCEQIRGIIEDNSASSEECLTDGIKFMKYKRRKYNLQSLNVRPVEVKTLKCNNCFRKFADLDGLKMHKHFCKLFYCQLCKPQIIFKDKDEREKHKKKYHCHSLVCHLCGKNYSQSYLVKHFKNHFEDRKKCPFCRKTLKNMTILMTHLDNVHGNRFSSICEVCGGSFKNLKKHLLSCRKSGSKQLSVKRINKSTFAADNESM